MFHRLLYFQWQFLIYHWFIWSIPQHLHNSQRINIPTQSYLFCNSQANLQHLITLLTVLYTHRQYLLLHFVYFCLNIICHYCCCYLIFHTRLGNLLPLDSQGASANFQLSFQQNCQSQSYYNLNSFSSFWHLSFFQFHCKHTVGFFSQLFSFFFSIMSICTKNWERLIACSQEK